MYLEDIDLSNNVIYTNRHDGNNYSNWMRLQSAVLNMQDAWVPGMIVHGMGLAVQFPYFDDIQITNAQVFNRQNQWENITFSGDIHTCGNTRTVIFNFSETSITDPGPYLVRLSGTMK